MVPQLSDDDEDGELHLMAQIKLKGHTVALTELLTFAAHLLQCRGKDRLEEFIRDFSVMTADIAVIDSACSKWILDTS